MARKNFVRDNVPLSRFGVLVAQLESIVASAAQQSPDPLLCFDLLSDLISAIDEEPKDSISLWQRKCEDTLYSLLVLGARRPVRHLASVATAKIISKGDPISIYSRASSLQGFLSDGRKNEPQQVAGAALCLGELYRLFGRRITSGLSETTSIVSKLMKYHEEYVRKEAFYLLQNALEGCGGNAAAAAYTDAFRIIMRFGVGDKSFIVRKAAARCLTAFANVGGPGLAITELENAATSCVKAIDDPTSSVRDAFAEALGTLLALGMNPEAQVQPRGKGQFIPAKKLEGGLQRHLVSPFVKASGVRLIELRIGLTLAWVSFLQAILLKYLHPDGELQDFALQVIDMLRVDTSVDAQALACVLYILRVGVTDQMTEPIQRSFSVTLGKQLQSPDSSPSMKVAALRTLSYTLKTLGEVPGEFREVLDDTVVAALSHSSQLVRIEAALTLRALAEVDPTCVGGLISFGVTTLTALRENISFEKGPNFRVELDSLHGQANLLAALISISQNLPLGYPARLPKSVLEVSKKLLAESTRNPVAAAVEKEAAWLLLSSLLASIPREEFEDQVFDILTLWAPLFTGNAEVELQQSGDLASKISVRSVAIEALTAFIRCYVSPHGGDNTILLQPMLVYLSSALSYISFIAAKELPDTRTAIDVFTIRTLIAFQSLSDPMAYRSDHSKILHICTTPFRNASAYEESSCLRVLLDKRDSWLGPWIPGRDWFEDELRAFQGGRDSLMPCVWDRDMPSFPQPETIRQMLVNQMLLCFGILFAFQDSSEMLSLLGVIEQCLRAGRKQSWHAASVTNICVGLLAGLKACLSFHPQPLGSEILNSLQAIFQSILAEGDIAASLRRASAEGLGLLTRLGNDAFTASMTKSLLGDLTGQTDVNYTGSIALALGCIHRSAGGMALSSLVPATVSSISLLAKCSVAALQIWSLHGLLLTIEAAGLSYVSHVQATLSLALEILLAEENGWVDLQHGVGRLINAIVAALGPELAPGSIFFSRCRSVIAEISSYQETATLLERVRFTQQLVLFAPHALSVHSHVQTLLPTLSSRQPTLRHLAISTLRHLIEKDPVSVIGEHIEENLFHMLDEETDAEIGNLVRSTIMRLLYASCPMSPSHWIAICRKMVLAISTRNVEVNNGSQHEKVNNLDSDSRLDLGEDDENMVSSSTSTRNQGYASDASSVNLKREKHLRYRTRVFAAECSSHLPNAVGMDPAHFDLSLARKPKGQASGDWLVLQLQDLLSLAYQISTIQFESMQPIGIGLLSTIIDKFEGVPDPELPGHLLLEQYQAQLMSALRSALSASSGPVLLEAGLQLATKILTSGIIRGDQVAVKRIFALISRPLNDFNELYYPSFAEWVSGKIKMRLLAAHASLKCYTYKNLRGQPMEVPDEYTTLLSLISQNSSILAKHWIWILKDYCHVCFNQHLRKDWRPFLDGVQSPVVSSKLRPCLEEAWPLILQALALDAVPPNFNMNGTSDGTGNNMMPRDLISGYKMVELELEEFRFLWGFALLIIFQGKNPTNNEQRLQLSICKAKNGGESPRDPKSPTLKIHDIVLPVFQSLCTERFFRVGFLTVDICRELIQVFTCLGRQGGLWNGLVITVLAQILQNCPEDFLKLDSFAFLAMEICLAYLDYVIQRADATVPEGCSSKDLLPQLVIATRTLLHNIEPKMQPKAILAFMLAGYKCARVASTELSFSKTNELVLSTSGFLKLFIDDKSDVDDADTIRIFQKIIGACQNATGSFIEDCIESIHILENKKSSLRRLVHTKLAFCLEQTLFLADIAYKTRLRKKNCISFLNWAIFKDCIRCLRIVLADGNIQVQAIGLQVLRNTVQKSMTAKDDFFMVILIGELLGDILLIIKKMLKKPASRESVALAGECLKTLVLMQTLPSEDDCQKALMNLILEVIFMVLSETDSGPYEGSNEIRSAAVRLVSQLAQIPTAAVHIKNSLLGMRAMHREQIQGIIRASVAQEHNTQQVNPTVPNLDIKLPRQSEENREENSPAAPAPQSNEEFEDEEDDWDTFQSFPASTDTAPEKSDLDSDDPGSSEPNFGNNDSKNGPESNSIGSESCETHDHGSEERELGQNSGPPLAYSMKSVEDANESTEVSETTENVLTEENTGFEDLDHVPSSEINIIGQRQTGTSSQDSSTELELFSGDIKNEEHQGISQTSALSEEQHTTESVSNDQLQEIHESL